MEDLSVPEVPNLKNRISIYKDAYSATKDTHAIVVCTEWDEFMVMKRASHDWVDDTITKLLKNIGN